MERQQRTVAATDGMALAAEVHAGSDMPDHVPTVVLAHDWGLTWKCWEQVVEGLFPFGVRVVTWDQRGHGRSGLGLNRGGLDDLSIDDFGRDLHAVMRTLVPTTSPVVLVGHSLGGMTALSYLGHNLEEARARVVGAVLASTAATDVRLGARPKGGLGRLLGGGGKDPEEPPVRGNNHREVLFGDNPDRADVATVRAQFAATDPEVLRAAYHAFCRADVRPGLEALLRLPVSILAGAKDTVTPLVRSRAMTITLTSARFATLPGVGHMMPYESPDRIVAEVRWVLTVLRARMRAAAARRQAQR